MIKQIQKTKNKHLLDTITLNMKYDNYMKAMK